MAIVKNVTLKFPASPSADVVGYKLYVEPDPTIVTHSSPSCMLDNATPDGEGYVSNEFCNLDLGHMYDGIYNLGISAVDDVGNESSLSTLDGVALDFVAPDPPGPIVIVS